MNIVHAEDVTWTHRPKGRKVLPLIDLPMSADIGHIAVLLARHPERFVEDRHLHQEMFEIFYFLHDADYWIDGHEYSLSAGDLVVLHPGEPHGALPVDHPVDIVVFQVPKVDGDKAPYPR